MSHESESGTQDPAVLQQPAEATTGPKKSGLAKERTDLAEDRTEWAEHRTFLANERTFSAWIRTGLSAMGGGLAVARLLNSESPSRIARLLGVILILVGAGACLFGFWRYHQITEVLRMEGLPPSRAWAARLITTGLMITAVLLLMLVFVE